MEHLLHVYRDAAELEAFIDTHGLARRRGLVQVFTAAAEPQQVRPVLERLQALHGFAVIGASTAGAIDPGPSTPDPTAPVPSAPDPIAPRRSTPDPRAPQSSGPDPATPQSFGPDPTDADISVTDARR